MARASSMPISPNFSPSDPMSRMVRDLMSSLTRGPSLDGGVGCVTFLIAMAKLLSKGPTRIRAEVLDRRDEVSMWIARGTSGCGRVRDRWVPRTRKRFISDREEQLPVQAYE